MSRSSRWLDCIKSLNGGGRTVSKMFIETSTHLIEGIDEMVKEGYYSTRTEAVNEAINQMLKQYKISKLHAKDARQAQHASGAG